MNPDGYDDQAYGSGRELDAQEGRLYGHMKREPLFLSPTTAEFWILVLTALGVVMLSMVLYAVLFAPTTRDLMLVGFAATLLAAGGGWTFEGLLRWLRTNRRKYPRLPGAQWKPRR